MTKVRVRVEPTGDRGDVRVRVVPRETDSYSQSKITVLKELSSVGACRLLCLDHAVLVRIDDVAVGCIYPVD